MTSTLCEILSIVYFAKINLAVAVLLH